MMRSPNFGLRWDDTAEVLDVTLDQEPLGRGLPMPFTTGNCARLHTRLDTMLHAAYERGRKAGQAEAKAKINDLIDWARS